MNLYDIVKITTAKIADLAVTTAKIADLAVTTAKITDLAVTTAKLANLSVTLGKLETDVQNALVPVGAIQAFAMNSTPSGWLTANGSNVSRTTYSDLFSKIGTTYGSGDGSTTFTLPNLNGIFVRGSGSQTIGGITYNKTFAAKEGDAFQGHVHDQEPSQGSGAPGGTGTGGAFLGTKTGDPISDGTNGTPRTASETRPANIALRYCIKF